MPRSVVLALANHATQQAGELLLDGAVGRLIEAIATEFEIEEARTR